MTKFVYLITSHIHPIQVVRLIKTIRKLSPNSLIAVHHDPSKSKLLEQELNSIKDVFIIPDPINVIWGDFSQVECFLHSLRWIKKNLTFDWLILISGQDYPISSLIQFENDISNSFFDGYFRYFPALTLEGNGWPANTGKKRYYFKYFRYPHFIYYYKVPVKIQNLISKLILLINRSNILNIIISSKNNKNKIGIRRFKYPFDDEFTCYGGWDWFNLNIKCIDRILLAVTDNKNLVDYYKKTYMPSESFVHTILVNTELKISNNSLRYVHWKGLHPTSPSVILKTDCESVIDSGMPFARKFDIITDSEVLDIIDEKLGIKE